MPIDIRKLDRICLAIVAIVTLASGYWFSTQVIKERRLIRQENEIISQKMKELNLAEANLEHLNGLLDTTKRKLESLNARIPESAHIGKVLKQVDALMHERKIVLTSMQPLPTVEEKHYTKIPIRLIFKGSFVNIYRLLHDLETMNRVVVTEKMVISRSSLADKCQVELIASVFQR